MASGKMIRTRTFSLIGALGLVAGMLAVLAPSAWALKAPCKVKSVASLAVFNGTGSNLQDAIYAAGLGDTLQVSGICVGNFAVSQEAFVVSRIAGLTPR